LAPQLRLYGGEPCALILERKPDLSPDALRGILISTAKDIGARGRDPEFGAGLVDAYQAILSLDASISGGPPAGHVSAPVQVSQ
jgi:hypothetical protein